MGPLTKPYELHATLFFGLELIAGDFLPAPQLTPVTYGVHELLNAVQTEHLMCLFQDPNNFQLNLKYESKIFFSIFKGYLGKICCVSRRWDAIAG